MRDARNLIVTTKQESKQEETYQALLKIVRNYNEKLLSTKVYWENPEEREAYKNFWEEYSAATSDEAREIAMLKKELHEVKDGTLKEKQIRQFYKNKLVEFGVMRQLKNRCQTIEEVKLKKVSVDARINPA